MRLLGLARSVGTRTGHLAQRAIAQPHACRALVLRHHRLHRRPGAPRTAAVRSEPTLVGVAGRLPARPPGLGRACVHHPATCGPRRRALAGHGRHAPVRCLVHLERPSLRAGHLCGRRASGRRAQPSSAHRLHAGLDRKRCAGRDHHPAAVHHLAARADRGVLLDGSAASRHGSGHDRGPAVRLCAHAGGGSAVRVAPVRQAHRSRAGHRTAAPHRRPAAARLRDRRP